jgi:NAD(P)-dependent dehydrogenase (short-subunit alcohol dehydrogenase family)
MKLSRSAVTTRTADQWAATQIPDQEGRVALVTGANSGVGFETARALAEHGAEVVLACRDTHKGDDAARRIRLTAPAADLTVLRLDLASLESVHNAAEEVRATHGRLDLLIDNAGLGWVPYTRTNDGLELTFATNHLGHFALTGQLLDLLLDVPGSRIVVVSSPAHRQGTINFDDLQSEKRYSQRAAYGQSKLANLLFAYELQRRLAAAGAETIALAAHPGGARSNFNRHLPRPFRGPNYGLFRPLSHSSKMGALSILRAGIDPEARGSDYYAPSRMMEFKGNPTRRDSSDASHNLADARRLWEISEELSGVTYSFGQRPKESASP